MGGELRGLRALVTGASKGIGYAVAMRLRDEGATVLGTARTAPPGLPNDVHFVAPDVTSVDGSYRRDEFFRNGHGCRWQSSARAFSRSRCWPFRCYKDGSNS